MGKIVNLPVKRARVLRNSKRGIDGLYDWSPVEVSESDDWMRVTCRMCGVAKKCDGAAWDGKNAYHGPRQVYEHAYEPSWFSRVFFGAKPRPHRMRRKCPFCLAVYYERVHGESNGETGDR